MRRLLAVLLLCLSSVVLWSPPAYACSCVEASLAEHFDGSDIVVAGTVDHVAEPLLTMQPGEQTTRFHVDRVYKGSAQEWIDVDTGGPCGFDYSIDPETVFFVDESGGELNAGICGGTGSFSAAEVATAYGPGVAPAPGGPGPHALGAEFALLAGIGAGGSLAVLAGFLWLRLRRPSR